MTPHWLAPMLPSLPPILHNAGQNSTPSYSKGSRGLSVLPQLTSIFTRTTISPGLWLRQWGSRYAIRAGRNLPDKEFRYLRHDCYVRQRRNDRRRSTVRSFLPDSSCRHEDRTVSSRSIRWNHRSERAWRTVSEDPPKISVSGRVRCRPRRFMPYANRTSASNPSRR